MTSEDPARSDALERGLAFIRTELGPASERLFEDEQVRQAVRDRLEAGTDVEDAVLAEVHGRQAGNRRVADEFAAYFLFDFMKMGKLSMSSSSRLRRFLDTGDLVNSVFGDLWSDVSQLKFETSNQFRRLFAQRMSWKAADEARRLDAGRRQEHRRDAARPEELDLHDVGPAPSDPTIAREEREQLILILLRLDGRDKQLLSRRLKGASIQQIADDFQMTYEAARKAVSRAVQRARTIAERSRAHRAGAGGSPQSG